MTSLTTLCSDSRQKVWSTDKSAIFEVEGKQMVKKIKDTSSLINSKQSKKASITKITKIKIRAPRQILEVIIIFQIIIIINIINIINNISNINISNSNSNISNNNSKLIIFQTIIIFNSHQPLQMA
jgi:hypothetical protein